MATLARLSFDDVSAIAEKVGYSTPAPVPREECNMTDKQSDHEHDPMVLLLSQTLERQSEIFVQGFKDVRHEMHTANRNQMILNMESSEEAREPSRGAPTDRRASRGTHGASRV